MSYATAAAGYRDMDVLTASPARLVVMVYDHCLVSLRRAQLAIENGNVELRVASLGKAREALTELQGTLDLDAGGEIARNLASLYAFLLVELMDVGFRVDARRLTRVTAMVAELREAFAQASGELGLAAQTSAA